ncbi:Structural maintenance of chromosomes protein 2 [Smittium culicis]|uniref:Structural maintenance of chromosomes protein 2 n=1 Tax=Smittium culicis TaxID=133412 RepID=A0A1R1Y8F9_9FUNG|nr:Structural maintenance of chromosomes protein 2 [Smittium culicis]
MKVDELIIDGFKSYASRTHVKGWDSEFNAITGLNGSGKSNILDAFCFVLGIKNYKMLRSSNIMDLIYKKGQAGITKASVTIVFDNTDKKTSPPGYEECRQITLTRQIMVGGKSKYMINGHNSQEQTVSNMLQAVQLNINNPHFLIMQGKITQVLNMQPKEILSMIEEAAGTRMFEDRKEKAIKTIAKKEKKIDEIQVILKEEITPKLDKLRAEKQGFLEYQKERINASEELLTLNQQKLNEELNKKEQLKAEINNIIESKDDITERRKKEIKKNGELQTRQESVDVLGKQMVKLKTKLDIIESSYIEEVNSQKDIQLHIEKVEKTLKTAQEKYSQNKSQFEKEKSNLSSQKEKIEKLDQLVQSLTTGVTSDESNDGGFAQQLQDAMKLQANARTKIEQSELKIKMLKSEKLSLEPKIAIAYKEIDQLLARKKELEKKIIDFQTKKQGVNYDIKADNELNTALEAERNKYEGLKIEEKKLSAGVSGLNLSFDDPEPGFDRKKVKGAVAQLVRLDKNSVYAAQALEVCAGGRLYNIVVDSDSTGAKLLEKGRLKKRVTIIPLNKINSYKPSINAIKAAKELAPGKVDLALTFVGYDKEVESAMVFVFGSTLICEDAVSAKTVTFNKAVKLKSVTLEGDVYDPSGTLQGGSRPSNSGILEKLSLLNEVRSRMYDVESSIRELTKKLDSVSSMKKIYQSLNSQLDLDQHALNLIIGQIESSSSSKLKKRLDEIDIEITNYMNVVEESKKIEKDSIEQSNKIHKDMVDFSQDKDGKLFEMKAELESMKKKDLTLLNKVKSAQKMMQASELEKDEIEAEFNQLLEQRESGKEVIEQLINSKKENEDLLLLSKKEFDELNKLLGNAMLQLKGFNKELQELDDLYKKKQTEQSNCELLVQQITREINRISSEAVSLKNQIGKMINDPNNSWILDFKHLFGQPNSAFDFVKQDPVLAKRELSTLKERLSVLVKTTNLTVQSNIEKVESRESGLKMMLKTVFRDKRKIQDTIITLDKYKEEALDRTWKIVDKDFGGIFSDLLPGNTARLDQIEGQPITSGLQVKVNLGGVWKNSLSELSGGQRSLIALSLILALLQFKPAPMYILDEIDAALDLSHTQNIGRLFKSRFKGSQFIVVSLKEGMFNNANVLFKVKFKNGVSTVERN